MIYLDEAQALAEKYKNLLAPHCDRIEVAGSIRRRRPQVKDIELCLVPKPYENEGLFVSGIATVINQWAKVKGELPCKYTKRLSPEGIVLDIFICHPLNWGLIFMIRTGSWEFSKRMVGTWLPREGYKSIDGDLVHIQTAEIMELREEADLFKLANMKFIEPHNRE